MSSPVVVPKQTVPMFAPDGSLGDIPAENLTAALKAGFKQGVTMKSADGKLGVIPADRVLAAANSGLQIVPLSDQETQHPGFWHSLYGDLAGMIPKPGEGGVPSPYPGVTPEVGQANWKNAIAQAQAEKDAGYGPGYRMAAGLAQGAGVNVSSMEQSAKEGDTAGVLGHAAAVPTVIAAGEGAGAVASRMPAMADLSLAKGRAVAKAGLRTVGNAASVVGESLDPDLVGLASPRAAHALRLAQKVGKVATKYGQETLDATKENVPFAGESEPAASALTQQTPTRTLQELNGATTPKALEQQLTQALGGKPLEKNVPLRQQLPALQKPTPATSNLPEGFTPVESSALSGYKYDAATREFESITKDGRHYIHGDVSPEEAQAFADAGSKGKAWQQLRSQNPLVGKVVNGKRVATIKSQAAPTGAEEPDTRVLGSDDLTGQLRASLHKVTGGEISPGVPRYVFRARDIGEEGIPLTNEHASATSSPGQAMRYAEPGQRSQTAGQVVRVDLSKLSPKDYVVKQHPDGPLWIQFTRPLAESEVEQWSGAAKNAGK